MSTDQIFVFPLRVLRVEACPERSRSVVNRLFSDTVIILSRGSATITLFNS
jgi:hypothetical protein